MSDTPSPESLKAAEAICDEYDVGRYHAEDHPYHSSFFKREHPKIIARHIDAAYADLRERCERMERAIERVVVIRNEPHPDGAVGKATSMYLTAAAALSPTPKEPTHG